MKKIINGKKYDTTTAVCVKCISKGVGTAEYLYRKKTGEFFIHYETCWDGCEDWIEPLTDQEAREAVAQYCNADIYEKFFGEVAE